MGLAIYLQAEQATGQGRGFGDEPVGRLRACRGFSLTSATFFESPHELELSGGFCAILSLMISIASGNLIFALRHIFEHEKQSTESMSGGGRHNSLECYNGIVLLGVLSKPALKTTENKEN